MTQHTDLAHTVACMDSWARAQGIATYSELQMAMQNLLDIWHGGHLQVRAEAVGAWNAAVQTGESALANHTQPKQPEQGAESQVLAAIPPEPTPTLPVQATPVQQAVPSMPEHWHVEVSSGGETILSIGPNWVSGQEGADEQTIIGAAKHLLAFVGYGLPPSSFDPDATPPQAASPAEAVQPATRPTDDELWDQTLRERDDYHEWADKLAQAIAAHLGVDIGEHSSANNPWQQALVAISEASPAEAVGEVVITKDAAGRIVAVTRQDAEGRILKVIAESAPQAQPQAAAGLTDRIKALRCEVPPQFMRKEGVGNA